MSGHIKLLHQAGLIEATDLSCGGDTLWFPGALTWDGHEFLSAVRNETVWKKTAAVIKQQSGLPFEIIKALALKYLATLTGLSVDE